MLGFLLFLQEYYIFFQASLFVSTALEDILKGIFEDEGYPLFLQSLLPRKEAITISVKSKVQLTKHICYSER